MSDIKSDFRVWLQKNFSKSTAYSYYALVQKIFDKNFDDSQDWQKHSESIMPLLVRYFEFANWEYSLDRVTIWYALDYFKKIVDYIKLGHLKKSTSDADIFIFDGDKDFPVCSTGITELYDNVVFIQRYLFESTDNLPYNSENVSVDVVQLVILMSNIKETTKLDNLKNAAIRIVYNKNISAEKTALSRYCNFLYSATANSAFDYKGNPVVNMVTTKSPKNYISGFIEVEPITGEHARSIRPNPEAKRYTDVGYVYSTRDLANIFNIDFKTASDLMMKFGIENKITTTRDGYYNAEITHKILKVHHHYKDKKQDEIYSDVDYTKAGYEHWKTRKDAMMLLGIKKLAFYSHVVNKCLYIDYAKGAPRYYQPELKYLKNLPSIKRIKNRKNNIKTK